MSNFHDEIQKQSGQKEASKQQLPVSQHDTPHLVTPATNPVNSLSRGAFGDDWGLLRPLGTAGTIAGIGAGIGAGAGVGVGVGVGVGAGVGAAALGAAAFGKHQPSPPYPDNFVGPLAKGEQHVSDIKVDKPTVLNNGMGPTQVYPDNFVGPLPPGAFSASDYKKRLEIYSEISHGTSKVSIDTSNFMIGPDGKALDPTSKDYAEASKKAEAFRSQQLGYLASLVKTNAGYALLSELGHAKNQTKIERSYAATNETKPGSIPDIWLQPDGSHGKGSGSEILMNTDLTSYAQPGQKEEAWMTDRSQFGLYHELIHALHANRGDTSTGRHKEILNAEWQVMGMGPYNNEAITDNVIRQQMNKEQRPNYSGVEY